MSRATIEPQQPAAIRVQAAGCVRTQYSRHWTGALGACVLVGALAVLPAASALGQAAPKAGKVAGTNAETQALIDEVRRAMLAGGRYSAKQIDAVVALLQNRDMAQIRDMAQLKGSAVKGAERLTGGSGVDPNRPQSDQAGTLLGSTGVTARTGNASPKELQAGPAGGGLADRSGFASANAGCEACPGTYSGRSSAGPARSYTPAGSPHTSRIDVYSDGSARISYTDGTHEYLNNEYRLVDEKSAPIPNRTPRPDGAGAGGGTRVTMADVRRIEALRGQLGIPNPEKTPAGGGPVDTVRASTTTTTGLFTEQATGTYVSDAEIGEILRVALEKLRGPVIP